MKKTTVISLWGGSGLGKSSNAARLYSLMKALEVDLGFTVELVREKAKLLAWAGVGITQQLQRSIYFDQLHEEMRLIGAVDFIVTDSPTAISPFYAQHHGKSDDLLLWYEGFKRAAKEVRSVDLWCTRLKPFLAEGRYETEEQAKGVDAAMRPWFEGAFKPFDGILDRADLAQQALDEHVLRILADRP